jgi:hypothetical protein
MNFRRIISLIGMVFILSSCARQESIGETSTLGASVMKGMTQMASPSKIAANSQVTPSHVIPSLSVSELVTKTVFQQPLLVTLTPSAEITYQHKPLNSGEKIIFSFIEMYPDGKGWGGDVGGHIFHTNDFGETWLGVQPESDCFYRGGFFSKNGDVAWATPGNTRWFEIGYCKPTKSWIGELWSTSDGGSAWVSNKAFPHIGEDNENITPTSLQITQTGNGFFLWSFLLSPHNYYSEIWTTSDANSLWKRENSSDNFGLLSTLWMVDADKGYLGERMPDLSCSGLSSEPTMRKYMSGEVRPQVHVTMDGGKSWQDLILPQVSTEWIDSIKAWIKTTNKDYSSECAHADVITIPGQREGGIGIHFQWRGGHDMFYYSVNGKDTWRQWLSNGSEYFLNANTGWRLKEPPDAAGNYQLLTTQDGGSTWNSIARVSWKSATLDFIDAQNGWAIARDALTSSLLRTSDGGRTWRELPIVVQ